MPSGFESDIFFGGAIQRKEKQPILSAFLAEK